MQRHLRHSAVIVSLVAARGAAGQVCPPGQFDYGPVLDEMAAGIVMDHDGWAGPLLPAPAGYARVVRDVALIRAAAPELTDVGHWRAMHRDQLIIISPLALSEPVVCANLFYQAEVQNVIPQIGLHRLGLPAPLNVDALAEIYLDLPGVTEAGPNFIVCVPDCCESRWGYEPRAGGTWRWRVERGCPWGVWVLDVTEGGAVSLQPCSADWNGDAVVNSADISAFLGIWLTDLQWGTLQADFNADVAVDSADISAFPHRLDRRSSGRLLRRAPVGARARSNLSTGAT